MNLSMEPAHVLTESAIPEASPASDIMVDRQLPFMLVAMYS